MAFRGIQTTNIISTDVGFSDPLLILNKDGIQATDVGFLGKLGPTTYAGLVRDSETSNFLLLDSIELAPSTINDVSALDASIVKGSITVGTLTADTIIAGNIPSTLSDLTDIDNGSATTGDLILYDGSTWSYVNLESEINTRITASQNSQSLIGLSDVGHTSDTVANGDFLLYDSSTSKFAFVDFASEVNAYADARISLTLSSYATKVGYNLADETDTTSIVLNPGDASTPATYRGDVVDDNGNVIVDVSSTTATFTGGLIGNTYGDVYDTSGANKVLESGTNNLDSSLTVDTANATTLNAGTTNISGNAVFTGSSADFTGTTTIGNWNGAVYDRTGSTLIIDDTAVPKPIVYANIQGGVVGDVLGNVVGNLDGNVTGNLEGNIINSQGQPVIDNSGELSPTVFRLPKGLTADRPSPAVAGMMFFNEGTSMFEGYDGTAWVQLVPSTFQSTP